MALDKAIDSAKLDGALTATAEAIRGKTGDSAKIAFDGDTGFAAAVDAIQTGGGAYELLYETTFTIEDTPEGGTANKSYLVIDTGLGDSEDPPYSDTLWAVITCENDTEPDFTYPHFAARAMEIHMDAQYVAPQQGSGILYNTNYRYYGYSAGLYVVAGAPYCNTLTFGYSSRTNNWGIVASGDYRFRLFRINEDLLGLGGYKK